MFADYKMLHFRTEADEQYKRDKLVEGAMLQILGGRLTDCIIYHRSGLDRDDPDNACQVFKVIS